MSNSNYKKMILLADPHVWSSERNAKRAALRGNKPGGLNTWSRADELAQISESITFRFDPKDYIVLIAGDIVEGGNVARTRALEYENAEESLQPLVRPWRRFEVHMVPGNHDYGPFGNFFAPDARQKYLRLHRRICRYATTFPESKDYGSWRLLLLDSTAHKGRASDFARGRIGPIQLSWLQRELSSSQKPTVIAFHHHPEVRTLFGRKTLAIEDEDQFWQDVSAFSSFPITVVCGHKHVEDLDLVRSGNLRAIAAGQCSQDLHGIIFDPVKQQRRRVNLRTSGAIRLEDVLQIRGVGQRRREDTVLNNRRMASGCTVEAVNLVRLNRTGRILDGPSRKISIGPREIAGALIREDRVGTNSLRVVIRTWNGSATHLRYRVIYTVRSSGGTRCTL